MLSLNLLLFGLDGLLGERWRGGWGGELMLVWVDEWTDGWMN